MKEKVNSWGLRGNYLHKVCYLFSSDSVDFKEFGFSWLPYGKGRSYGDVCLNPSNTLVNTDHLDSFISFDPKDGTFECESGVTLKSIQNYTQEFSYLLPVSPGSEMISLGGAIANDVHGKNHHVAGSFGNHILSFSLLRSTGKIIECSRYKNSRWFYSTIGGFGMTGLILKAKIRLKKVPSLFLKVENVPFKTLEDFFRLADSSEKKYEYTVAWVDCTSEESRGIFMRANYCKNIQPTFKKKDSIHIPNFFSFSIVNRFTLKIFNALYFMANKNKGSYINNYKDFFYPLDRIDNWNILYGPKGFLQYQCVLPYEHRIQGAQLIYDTIRRYKAGSFLSVIKTFGAIKPLGMMSFPMRGVTVALDFVGINSKNKSLFVELDSIVRSFNGRIYLAKDCTMSKSFFQKSYPMLTSFMKYCDPNINSSLSRRLLNL